MLAGLKIFEAAAAHVAAGRQYHFVSLVPCRPLQELADRARRSTDLTVFTQKWLTGDLGPVFDQLAAAEVLGSAEAAWTTLRGMRFSVHDEDDIVRMNSMLAELHLTGGTGHLISIAIGDVLLCNLGRRLTRTELLGLLADDGIQPIAPGLHRTAREQVASVTSSWRESVQRELLHPPIERAEANQLIDPLELFRIGLVTGTAGGGKTSVLDRPSHR